MKIITNGQSYPCTGRPTLTKDTVRFNLPDTRPDPAALGELIELVDDGGNVLADITTADYARHYIDGTALVLTNEPEPGGPALEEVKASYSAELNAACSAAITGGCDVTLADGTTGHISLSAEDQINLSAALSAVEGGAVGYPYHLDGKLCAVYSAADIRTMAMAATQHKLYHTTLCNHYHVWVARCTAVADVQAITYGSDLPADLKANMEAIMNAVTA